MTLKSGNRVVVTGIGLVTPVGIGVDESWGNLLAGKSGIARITHFDPSEFPSQIAGEVKNFDASQWILPKDQRKMDRFIHLGIAASAEALEMSGFLDGASDEDKAETAVVLGSGIGGLPMIEDYYSTLEEKGPRRLSPFLIPSILGNLLAGQVAEMAADLALLKEEIQNQSMYIATLEDTINSNLFTVVIQSPDGNVSGTQEALAAVAPYYRKLT